MNRLVSAISWSRPASTRTTRSDSCCCLCNVMYRQMFSASSRSRKSTRAQCPSVVPSKRTNIASASSCMRLSLIVECLFSSSCCLCSRLLHYICCMLRIRWMKALNGKIIRQITENAHLAQAILHSAKIGVCRSYVLRTFEHIGRPINQNAVSSLQKLQEFLQPDRLNTLLGKPGCRHLYQYRKQIIGGSITP